MEKKDKPKLSINKGSKFQIMRSLLFKFFWKFNRDSHSLHFPDQESSVEAKCGYPYFTFFLLKRWSFWFNARHIEQSLTSLTSSDAEGCNKIKCNKQLRTNCLLPLIYYTAWGVGGYEYLRESRNTLVATLSSYWTKHLIKL